MDSTERLRRLRDVMKTARPTPVQALLVPTEDEHHSEYVAACARRRAFLCGFTGSAGTAVVTETDARLWTDGRYFLQAEKQLEKGWTLMKQLPEEPTLLQWLAKNLTPGSAVGVDPMITSYRYAGMLTKTLHAAHLSLISLECNLVDLVWVDRPPPPTGMIQVHSEEIAGQSCTEKLVSIRHSLETEGAQALVVSALDEVAWLFNIRGSDIDYNPVVIAYALVTMNEVRLYVDLNKVDDSVRAHLSGVEIRAYDRIVQDVKELGKMDLKVAVDRSKCSLVLYNALPPECVVETLSIVAQAKAIKNPTEIRGLHNAHIRDGIALVRFLSWMEECFNEGPGSNRIMTECTVADALQRLRAEQDGFVGLSFATISASGANGAIIHYKPERKTCARVTQEALYLVDSGAQYRDGTTDVTRTMHFGIPTDHERECFTRVLQGHIHVCRCVFPGGTAGRALDALTRLPLWSIGLDYQHGTGHGVGAFLNVHEGPQGISGRKGADFPLRAGMTMTIEPGYYEDGKFGIRIENTYIVREVETPHRFGGNAFLGFECLTMAPIQTKMMKLEIMTDEEIEWVNTYHATVLQTLSPFLSGAVLEYLKRETSPLRRQC